MPPILRPKLPKRPSLDAKKILVTILWACWGLMAIGVLMAIFTAGPTLSTPGAVILIGLTLIIAIGVPTAVYMVDWEDF